MSPRNPYRLGKRAESMRETRRLIVEAASEVFAERGIRSTPFLEVARRASVAPATVSHHFSNKDQLVVAAIDHIVQLLDLPSTEIFDGVDDLDDRLALLFERVYESYKRAEPWRAMSRKESDDVPAIQEGTARVRQTIRALLTRALGELAEDDDVIKVMSVTLHTDFRALVIETGMSSSDNAARVAHQLSMRWLSQHLAFTASERR